MMEIRCPKCHEASTDPDFCSECGAAIASANTSTSAPPVADPGSGSSSANAANTPSQASAPVMECPDCHEPRPGLHARYCDNCRYDFVACKSFTTNSVASNPAVATSTQPPLSLDPSFSPSQPAMTATPAVAAVTLDPVPSNPAFSAGLGVLWDVVASVDRSMVQPGDPMPPDLPERVFPLDFDESLIGRRSDKDGIHPEISLSPDSGVSKKHARITRNADGSLTLLDLGSTNGTFVNGVALMPNVPKVVTENDKIQLGAWTLLVLRRR